MKFAFVEQAGHIKKCPELFSHSNFLTLAFRGIQLVTCICKSAFHLNTVGSIGKKAKHDNSSPLYSKEDRLYLADEISAYMIPAVARINIFSLEIAWG